MRFIRKLIGLVVLGLVAGFAAFALGMRSKSPVVLDAIRKFNRDVSNPAQMRSAGTPGAFASVVRHQGRRSGQTYETPVVAVPTDHGFVIALPYGSHSDWLQNVLASGQATIGHQGSTFEVHDPQVLPMAEMAGVFPRESQRLHRMFKVDSCLRVKTMGAPAEGGSAEVAPVRGDDEEQA